MHQLEEILHPKSIAVTGASQNPSSRGYSYTDHLVNYGFKGEIYPVNPKYSEILGHKAYPSVADIPGEVDYVISCVPAPQVLKMLEDCSQKRVKAIHFFTARFSETGNQQAAELEQEILKQAQKSGIRLIGPNCMGLYHPKEGISFAYDLPLDPGPVGFISQTGGGAATFVHMAGMRGIRFSKVISYGNALDFTETDYLEYMSQDQETKIILMYIEGVKDGKRFFNALRNAASLKPVVVIKGGRGKAGSMATASHTASMAGSYRTWEASILQAGAVLAQNLEEMTDLAVAFCFMPPIKGLRVGIAGGGGGPSVLAADECEEIGLEVIPLPPEIRQELKTRAPEIWDWIGNPTDASILGGFGFTGMDMLQMMSGNDHFDILMANNPEVPLARKEDTIMRFKTEVERYVELKKITSKPFLVILGEKSLNVGDYTHWRWQLTGELRSALVANNVAFFPTIDRAARAVKKVFGYYNRKLKT